MEQHSDIREVSRGGATDVVYSFGSLVTDRAEYQAMVGAFVAKGFSVADCEFLYVDNSNGNRLDAFAAYNRFLLEARGSYVILCHQDILPINDGRAKLDRLIAELNARDADWGLCGNAGRGSDGRIESRITHGEGHELTVGGPFPARVISLDENFILVRRDANLALSHNLSGFHWYGSDLCLVAEILGWNAYVIDFHIFHKSTGNIKKEFRAKGTQFRKKYEHAFRSRWQYVPTSQDVFLSGSRMRTFLARAGNKVRRTLRALRR